MKGEGGVLYSPKTDMEGVREANILLKQIWRRRGEANILLK